MNGKSFDNFVGTAGIPGPFAHLLEVSSLLPGSENPGMQVLSHSGAPAPNLYPPSPANIFFPACDLGLAALTSSFIFLHDAMFDGSW